MVHLSVKITEGKLKHDKRENCNILQPYFLIVLVDLI